MACEKKIAIIPLETAGHDETGVAHAYLGHAIRAESDSSCCGKLDANIIEDI